MATLDELKAKIIELIEKSQEIKEQIDEAKEWSSINKVIANIGKIVAFITNIVLVVQEVVEWTDDFGGEEKLDIAVELLDEYIKLPLLLELVDGPAFRIIISIIVYFVNEKYGHDTWPAPPIDSVPV